MPTLEPALRRPDYSHLSALLLITIATLPLLLLFLGTGDSVDMMELFNLVPVREAFRDGHWLMPTLNGVPRLEKPPLPVWGPAGLAALFHSDSLWILRMPSVLLGLLAGFATYGLGCLFFERDPATPEARADARRYATLAAILLPTMIIFNRQARLASYDIFATGFLTCGALFLALLAERGKSARAWTLLVLLAGISTGLSVMSKGPVPAAIVMLPLGLWLLIFHRRPSVWIGVAGAALISVAVFFPWLWVIGKQYPEAWTRWRTEFIQFGTGEAADPLAAGTKAQLQKTLFYYVAMLVWVAPLTPTLIGGLLLPFLPSHADPLPTPREKRGRWLLWLILVGGLILLTVPSEKKPRYALQLFPFAALLCAAVWQEFARMRAARKIDAAAGLMLAAQALFFIVPGIAAAAVWLWLLTGHSIGSITDSVSAMITTREPWSAPTPPPKGNITDSIATMLTPWTVAGLLIVSAAGVELWRASFRRRFIAGMLWLGICSWGLVFVGEWAYRLDPATHTNPARAPAEAAVALVGHAQKMSYTGGRTDIAAIFTFGGGDFRPWLSTLFYANQIIPEMTPAVWADQIAHQGAARNAAVYLMVIIDAGKGPAPTDALLLEFENATGRHREEILTWTDEGRKTALFRFPPPTPATRETAPAK